MSIQLNEKFVEGYISDHEALYLAKEAKQALASVVNKDAQGRDFLGWVDLPENYDKQEFENILKTAQKIKDTCDVFIVLGIGGSYLGARAAIEFVKSPLYNNLKKDTPDIYFVGNNISTTALTEVLSICEGKDICLNVISKSGTTTEPAVAFRVFRNLLLQKYGEAGAKERIFVTTDKCRGTLKSFADQNGYPTFVVPDDVGGRFSVLTAVGLLPIAVAGIDITAMMQGASDARKEYLQSDENNNTAMKYAILRNALYRKGKTVEIMVGYEPYCLMLNEWWKQLFGESEGKDQKGILPDSVVFSTDLHSLGQYIQDGQRILFETVLNIQDCGASFVIPNDEANVDGLNFLSGKDLDHVNKTTMLGTLFAHYDGGVPNIVLDISDRTAYTFGALVYFFEMACAISGYMLGVNPFDQPGVESYKKNMFALLGKSGYEKEKEKLLSRMQ